MVRTWPASRVIVDGDGAHANPVANEQLKRMTLFQAKNNPEVGESE